LIITMVLAALIGFLLSRGLTRPVIELTAAAQNLAAGDLNQTVDVRSADELGELSQAFNRMSKKIEHSDRLRKQMTADIAHDLRTPLTVIGGYIESMRDGDLEATPERMDLIYSEITRLNRLVGDLQLLSQSDAGVLPMNLETVDARELLEQTRKLFDLKAREREIDLLVEAEQGLPSLMADESRLMQVLENLVSNAMRHTPQGGTIRLKAKIGSGADSKARGVEFIVSDSGEGIPPESLPDVFERFHRVDKSRHANQSQSGLGLAIVKVIVQAHKGEVWVESAIGKGSEFHFVIPVA
jgi:signal transduction histidine kinase